MVSFFIIFDMVFIGESTTAWGNFSFSLNIFCIIYDILLINLKLESNMYIPFTGFWEHHVLLKLLTACTVHETSLPMLPMSTVNMNWEKKRKHHIWLCRLCTFSIQKVVHFLTKYSTCHSLKSQLVHFYLMKSRVWRPSISSSHHPTHAIQCKQEIKIRYGVLCECLHSDSWNAPISNATNYHRKKRG